MLSVSNYGITQQYSRAVRASTPKNTRIQTLPLNYCCESILQASPEIANGKEGLGSCRTRRVYQYARSERGEGAVGAMDRGLRELGLKSVEELGAGPKSEKAITESIRAKVRCFAAAAAAVSV